MMNTLEEQFNCIYAILLNKYEVKEQSTYNNLNKQARMSCMDKQQDFLDLKMEHQSDQYLFKQLLNCPVLEQDRCIDDFLMPNISLQQEFIQSDSPLTEMHIISEVSRYINFKTTPMTEIMNYIEQFYPLPHSSTRAIYLAARKLKLRLKRQHAKKRPQTYEKRQSYMYEEVDESLQQKQIKTEDSGVSAVLFVDESLQTMKKKRNRMSAQNSRDRKKEYLEQIERQNQQLKAQVARLSAQPIKKVAKPKTQEFLKVILCLGITCFLNIGPNPCLTNPLSKEIIPVESVQIPNIKEDPFSKLKQISNQFDYFKKLLPLQNQLILDQFLGQSNDMDNLISPSGQTMLKCLSLMEGDKSQYFQKIKQLKDKLPEMSPQINFKTWISP